MATDKRPRPCSARLPWLLALAPMFWLSGCTYGLIYTDVTLPLTLNMHGQTRGEAVATGEHTIIKEPVTGAGVRAEWASQAIGAAAKRGNLTSICYADTRSRSILAGLWEAHTVMVYGEPETEKEGD
jgi:hypothetical protein